MCLICALSLEAPKKVSVAELIEEFKAIPPDESFPERLRLAAAFVSQWQISVLMRLPCTSRLNSPRKSKAQ
jgi:hypothetical protein